MNNETVYIVSGFMRCGTSMMMRALEAGGLQAVSRASRDAMRKSYADEFYDPNEGGLYELEMSDYKQLGFPRQFKGKLIKCLLGGINEWTPVPKIKCVFMRRDIEEIRQSYLAFFDQPLTAPNNIIEQKIDLAIQSLANRRDTEFEVFWYADVIADPLRHFELLREQGWPIDPVASAAIVNPELYRFRKERLTVGIV